MSQVSPECAIAYAIIGGWHSQNDIITAVAVAMQESDLQTDAANSCCVGLWQINLKAHNVTASQMKNPVANAQTAFKVWTAAGGKWCATGDPAKHNCNPWQAYGASQPGRTWNQAVQQSANAYMSVIAKGIGNDILSGGKPPEDVIKYFGQKGVNCIAGDILSPGLAGVGNPLDAAGAVIAAFNRMGGWITNPDNLMRIVKVALGVATVLVASATLADKQIAPVVGKAVKYIK